MNPNRPEEQDLSHIASMIGLLEHSPTRGVRAQHCVVMDPSYWIGRLDALLESRRLTPLLQQRALALKQRLARLVENDARPMKQEPRVAAAGGRR